MQLVASERGEAVHLHDGERPVLEIQRELHRIEGPPVEIGDTQTLLRGIASPEKFQEALRGGTVFEYRHWTANFQVMAFLENGSLRLELRRII